MTDFSFIQADPLPSAHGPGSSRVTAFFDTLNAKPGKWFVYGDFKHRNSLTYLKRRAKECGLDVEVTSRAQVIDGKPVVTIYGRVVA